ncbi:MAG: pyruvate dehydrogenase (acetyl-transferring), homodimeric type, partial [Gammaproteobacteria bacterium]|nr:pyruvate dehydrogenase (acetyl-transferring), homodimeric type [Gammaproteobacteria bacterium]
VRENFFRKYPDLKAMVENLTYEDIWRLNRGGHDPHKIYAAYHAATHHEGQPTVILAKTVKGYGMGEAGEGQNTTHQQKKMGEQSLLAFRDRFNIPLTDEEVAKTPFYRPAEDSDETRYLLERREALGGFLPARKIFSAPAITLPKLDIFKAQLEGTGDREVSTTMAFVRILSSLIRDKSLKDRIVPIIPDESRTFGMEGMFRQLGIYSPHGQLYEPVDSDQLMFYREDKTGQVLQEGISEAGAMSSWIAAGTSYSNHDYCAIPFFILYSMFGFQRIGDLCWAAGDSRARGFILGGTAGRTTLAGEGLQHQDGHSLILASTVPNCVSYDPTYSYELAVIIHDGLRRMYQEEESIYYYITVMNENYPHPAMPENVEEGILRGMYLLKKVGKDSNKNTVQILGSGTILREAEAAAEILDKNYNVNTNIWSVTSFNELARDGNDVERQNRLHPDEPRQKSYVELCLENTEGPVIAATDYMRLYAEQIRAYVPGRYSVLGTDGFGRSDTRAQLRKFFEVDQRYIATAALKALADQEAIDQKTVVKAIQDLQIDTAKPNPRKV